MERGNIFRFISHEDLPIRQAFAPLCHRHSKITSPVVAVVPLVAVAVEEVAA
jgi:hypothetical protein